MLYGLSISGLRHIHARNMTCSLKQGCVKRLTCSLGDRAGSAGAAETAIQKAISLPMLCTAAHVAMQAAALSEEARRRLDGVVQQLGLASRLTLHPEAVYTATGNISVNTAGRSR